MIELYNQSHQYFYFYYCSCNFFTLFSSSLTLYDSLLFCVAVFYAAWKKRCGSANTACGPCTIPWEATAGPCSFSTSRRLEGSTQECLLSASSRSRSSLSPTGGCQGGTPSLLNAGLNHYEVWIQCFPSGVASGSVGFCRWCLHYVWLYKSENIFINDALVHLFRTLFVVSRIGGCIYRYYLFFQIWLRFEL